MGLQYFYAEIGLFMGIKYISCFQILVFWMILKGNFEYTGYRFFRYIGIPLTPLAVPDKDA